MIICLHSQLDKDDAIHHLCCAEVGSNPLIEVEIRERSETRTSAQNRYLWGTVYKTLSDETGYEKEEIHEMTKLAFLPCKVIKIGSIVKTIPPSTAKLKKKPFSDYVEEIARWAAIELSIVIPDAQKWIISDKGKSNA